MGTYNIPLASVFDLEPREVVLVLEKASNRLEFDHYSNFSAIKNAIGLAFSKGYKYENIFEKTKTQSKKEISEEEKEDLINYFENW